MADSAPITTEDLDALKRAIVAALTERLRETEQRFTERLHDTEERFTEQLRQNEERTTEQMRDTEIKLLRAFHGWARPAEIRIRDQATLTHGFDERLALIEERVSHLERKEPTA